jgi:AcrR family transcriptional regulator
VNRQAFHHGNLRAELLDRAEVVLRERGVETLSLRELARDAGVSHAAPRAHFIDKAALLDALAERGFERLAEAASDAANTIPDDESAVDSLRRVGAKYLEFADHNSALVGLMLSAKADDPTGPVHTAATRLLINMTVLVASALAHPEPDTAVIQRLTLVLSSTIQGIASAVASGRTSPAQSQSLLDDAVQVFVAGATATIATKPAHDVGTQ